MISVKISVPEKIYIRNPEDTLLGKNIIKQSIILIDGLGFEAFTFKKLASAIDSTEASIYRYFESKHNLLVYLVSWYWGWIDYQITYQTNNITEIETKIKIALKVLVDMGKGDVRVDYIDEGTLHKIVIAESSKAYHTKSVDIENKAGFFKSYKNLCDTFAHLFLLFNDKYPYAHALASTILEASQQQMYFTQHLPSLTEVKNDDNYTQKVEFFLQHLVFGLLEK